MKNQILDKTKKKRFTEKVSYLGINKIPYLLIKSGKDRIRGYSGSFSNQEISKIQGILNTEVIGLYIAKEAGEDIRLSVDALHMLKEQIKENIIELNEEQEKTWFLGKDIMLNEEQKDQLKDMVGFFAVKSGEDFIGTGKLSQDKKTIFSYLPKARRIKN